MAKKRQNDFQKTQMRVGRSLHRRRNVTDTSFKAKKIMMPSSKAGKHQNSSSQTLDCLSLISGATHLNARTSALASLNHQIVNNKDFNLLTFLSDVLKAVLKLVLEPDEPLRIAATEVIINVLNRTKDLQLKSFVPLIVNVLSCAMTHSNMRIRENSLKLLTPLLKNHPDLICHSTVTLNHLLEMLVGLPRTRTHSQVAKPPVIYSDEIYSPIWRIHILAHVNLFLMRMLEKKSAITDDNRDEQEVYWDSESPLHLQIYAGHGLKPVDIEKSYSYIVGCQELCDDSEILAVLENILHVFPAIYAEEVAGIPKGDDELLKAETIHNFCILFKVLRSIAEWLQFVPSEEMDKAIRKFLKECVYDKKRFPFKQRAGVFAKQGPQATDCVQLNLAVCYLFSTYLLDSVKDKEDLFDDIFTYVKNVFRVRYSDVQDQSIPWVIKILKIYLKMKEIPEVSEFLCDILCLLCGLLDSLDKKSPHANVLKSLFTEMSLDSAYHFVAETNAMKKWYNWLLHRLRTMPTKHGHVDKKILGIIKKIANRRYPCFQKLLMSVDFSLLKTLLKYDDDDVRDTAIFLIYNMSEISTEFLNDIARVILTDTFPKKFAVRLIRMLTYRFSEKPMNDIVPEASIYNGRGLVDITQFLLNIAVDSCNVNNKKYINFDANEYTKAVKIIKDVSSYNVLPSLHWKEHSILFDVCARFLKQLPQYTVNNVATLLFKEILDNARVLPMHVVIAILKLTNHEMDEKYYRIQFCDLIFTALLTTSILTQMKIDDDWCQYNVIELTNSMDLNNQTAIETLNQIEFLKDNGLDGIVVYHMLRVCNFYLERQLIDHEDFETVMKTLENLKEKSSDKTIGQQPLFISLYNHFTSYFM